MATPDFVKFSRIGGDLLKVLGHMDLALNRRWETTLRRVARLRPSFDEDYDGGLELVGDMQECDSPQAAVEMMTGSEAFGLAYVARMIPANLYFYLFDITADQFSLTLS